MTKATTQLRLPAEEAYLDELEALRKADKRPKPPNWRLSPVAILGRPKPGKPGLSLARRIDVPAMRRMIALSSPSLSLVTHCWWVRVAE